MTDDELIAAYEKELETIRNMDEKKQVHIFRIFLYEILRMLTGRILLMKGLGILRHILQDVDIER